MRPSTAGCVAQLVEQRTENRLCRRFNSGRSHHFPHLMVNGNDFSKGEFQRILSEKIFHC